MLYSDHVVRIRSIYEKYGLSGFVACCTCRWRGKLHEDKMQATKGAAAHAMRRH